MSDEYQLRKDIDKIYDDIYDRDRDKPNIVKFEQNNSQLKSKGTIDRILNELGLTDLYAQFIDFVKSSPTYDKIYPVGSIYISAIDADPSELFGGTWEKIEDRFLLASGSSYQFTNDSDGFADNIGGEASHTLTIDEMPSHNHSANLDIRFLKNSVTSSSSNHVTGWSDHFDTRVPNASTNKGGGQAHNNMPPYLVVNVWMRIE